MADQDNKKLSRHTCRWGGLVMVLSTLMAACGGGDAGFSLVPSHGYRSDAAATDSDPVGAQNQAALERGAKLNRDTLTAAEQQAQVAEQALPAGQAAGDLQHVLQGLAPGQVAPKNAYTIGAVAAKAAAVRIAAYRFFNGSTGAHFFTTSAAERDTVRNTLSPLFSYEGAAFSVASAFSPGLSPVHRFYNTRSGVHFYTISETERADVVANLPQFRYEGVAYHASQVAGLGLTPLYRFYVPSRGFHFYTASASERDNLIANNSAYNYEGVGYHVLAADWRAEKLPHTGITSSQCYRAGSGELVNCQPTPTEAFMGNGAIHLNPQQDGYRAGTNAMNYSEVANPEGGNFPRTSCVRDNVSGLIWEGKTPTGERAGNNTYTNYGDGTLGDASAYVNRINQLSLCGYSDWRLPKGQELLALVNYGVSTNPRLDVVWFPNTASGSYWAADGNGQFPTQAWSVSFAGTGGRMVSNARLSPSHVRLVRGAPMPSPRFSYSTVAYGGDAANNLVNDAWTGLQWRRCEEGRVWSGSTCTGTPGTASRFTHEQALAHVRLQSGWRLPNVKELASLVDLSEGSGTRINPTAFPGGVSWQWSSSPAVGYSNYAWVMDFGGRYELGDGNRLADYAVRLVRINQ